MKFNVDWDEVEHYQELLGESVEEELGASNLNTDTLNRALQALGRGGTFTASTPDYGFSSTSDGTNYGDDDQVLTASDILARRHNTASHVHVITLTTDSSAKATINIPKNPTYKKYRIITSGYGKDEDVVINHSGLRTMAGITDGESLVLDFEIQEGIDDPEITFKAFTGTLPDRFINLYGVDEA